MTTFFDKAIKAYEHQQFFGKKKQKDIPVLGTDYGFVSLNSGPIKNVQQLRDEQLEKDTRYNEPKGKPKASEEQIDKVIDETSIYRNAKERILKAQREQVAYGIDKYPEPLNAATWDIYETLDHSLSEQIDNMHYSEMLREKLKTLMDELNDLRLFRDRFEPEYNEMKEEIEALQDFKARVELLGGEPFKVYQEQYKATPGSLYLSGADMDGDISCDLGRMISSHFVFSDNGVENNQAKQPPVPEPINYERIAKETANQILKLQRDMTNRGETF